MQIAKIQAAVKSAPNYRVKVGDLEVIGAPGKFRWSFDYIVRTVRENGKPRVAYGKRNAEEYALTLADDAFLNTDIKTFYVEPVKVAPAATEVSDKVAASTTGGIREYVASVVSKRGTESVTVTARSKEDAERKLIRYGYSKVNSIA